MMPQGSKSNKIYSQIINLIPIAPKYCTRKGGALCTEHDGHNTRLSDHSETAAVCRKRNAQQQCCGRLYAVATRGGHIINNNNNNNNKLIYIAP